MSAIADVLNALANGHGVVADELLAAMQELEKMQSDFQKDIWNQYVGHCYRHQAYFAPSPQFDNNCPACYWEHGKKMFVDHLIRWCTQDQSMLTARQVADAVVQMCNDD